jgi:hypothetical protein
MGSAFRARHVRDGQCAKSALARSESGPSWTKHVDAPVLRAKTFCTSCSQLRRAWNYKGSGHSGGGVLRQRVIRRGGSGIATWNRMFGGTISGVRRACADRDQRRIGENGGFRTDVRLWHRTLGCREWRSSGSESFVAMVETADLRERHDLAPGGRVDGARLRRVLPRGQVRYGLVTGRSDVRRRLASGWRTARSSRASSAQVWSRAEGRAPAECWTSTTFTRRWGDVIVAQQSHDRQARRSLLQR